MKVIIPVKSNSERVKNKNFRPFYDELSLTEILIKKLLNIFDGKDIYMSCDDINRKRLCDKYGINFLLRDKELTNNSIPMSTVITEVVKQIPGNDDIMWCLVTDPLFDDYRGCYNKWKELGDSKYDSLVVVYPSKEYILDSNYTPIGFGFGEKHIPTQYLEPNYMLKNTVFTIKRKAVFECKYYIGKQPYWYNAYNFSIDIDNENEFQIAQIIYKKLGVNKNEISSFNVFTNENRV